MRKIEIDYEHYSSLGDLPAVDRELVAAAKDARATAYAPSTGFRVGAAARLASGRIVASSNQESVVGPVGICAESGLLYNLQANYADDPVEALAIASLPDAAECYPCGMCRQVLADTEQRQAGRAIRVIMTSRDSATVVRSALDLLPFAFRM
ncbi:MAG: cytidine deaminase [Rikenellaceae bacterium]|nr:cytidine deaminase [Rikenellaceae bacterium]MCL2693267.1 cytidine deaminase [Rikenellaceae bacterium]